MKLFGASVLVLLCLAYVTCISPDLPGGDTSREILPSCSLIIPMDYKQTTTTTGAGKIGQAKSDGSFNIKVYGALFHLLHNDIPLYWIIRQNKPKWIPNTNKIEAYDIIKNVTQVRPSQPGTYFMREFRGSAFLITVPYSTRALGVIDDFVSSTGSAAIRVYKISEIQEGADPPGLEFPVRHKILKKPYAAVFDTGPNIEVQLSLLEAAGLIRDNDTLPSGEVAPLGSTTNIPGAMYRLMNKDDANSFSDDVCLSICTEPHVSANDADGGNTIPFLKAAKDFTLSGGNFLAQCHGIFFYEQCDAACTNSTYGFLTTKGVVDSGGPLSAPYTHEAADTPYHQFEGEWAGQGGSVPQIYLASGSQLWDTATRKSYWGVKGTSPSYYGTAGGKVDLQNYTQIGGTFFYLGGHSYQDTQPGAQVYMNALLVPSERNEACGFDIPETPPTEARRDLLSDNRWKPTPMIKKFRQGSNIGIRPGDPCNCAGDVYDGCLVCGGNVPLSSSCQGGCCFTDLCYEVPASECPPGSSLGNATTCSGFFPCAGACCTGSTNSASDCDVIPESLCPSPGVWLGPGTTCDASDVCSFFVAPSTGFGSYTNLGTDGTDGTNDGTDGTDGGTNDGTDGGTNDGTDGTDGGTNDGTNDGVDTDGDGDGDGTNDGADTDGDGGGLNSSEGSALSAFFLF